MSLKKTKIRSKKSNGSATKANHLLFIPMVVLVFIFWVLYRALFDFPVWFDEIIGKTIFFGLPVLAYASLSGFTGSVETLAPSKLRPGFLQGIAFGGMFGFLAALASIISREQTVVAAPLFQSLEFWYQFMLALFTGFWESLFFYGLVMTVIQAVKKDWPVIWQVLVTAVIFTLFHLPNLVLQADPSALLGYAILVGLFAVGQGFIFSRNQNLYTVTIVHAFWGMVLFLYTS